MNKMENEETKKQETDYLGRLNRLTEAESKEWLRLDAGEHRVKFLSDGKPFQQDWDGELMNKLRFDVESNEKTFSFSVTEGQTKQSLYGQILLVATKLEPKNTMIGKTITILVQGEGKKKRYTIPEAVGLEKDETNPKIKEIDM